MNKNDLVMNRVTKALGILVRSIDGSVSWVDFLPLSSRSVVAVGFKNGKTKYADVTGMSPLKATNHVMGCLEDVRVECQFMTSREYAEVEGDIFSLAMDVAYKTDELYEQIKSRDAAFIRSLVKKGIKKGCLPDFFLELEENTQLRFVFMGHISSGYFTTVDALLLTEE